MGSCRPRAVFMAFGTKGDVYPITAIASAFASDQQEYQVVLITNSAHKNLSVHLAARNISSVLISTPPVVSNNQKIDSRESFSLQKKLIERHHREECLSSLEKVFGDGPCMEGDFIVINFFALEGWSLAELFRVRCIVTAPYVVPYSAPSSFEQQFRKELPLLYKYLKEAPIEEVCWRDVIHWMWPLFTEEWGSWRAECLNLSPLPFTDPVTGLPMCHDWAKSPLLLYGFNKEIVECPDYWPSNVHICGFWFLPKAWQFSCAECGEISALSASGHLNGKDELCAIHADLECFLKASSSCLPIFIGLSSIPSMGFLLNPRAFLRVLKAALERTDCRFILFTAGYEPLDATIQAMINTSSDLDESRHFRSCTNGVFLFKDRLFCFSGTIPYNWIFPRCSVVIHHGGSGSTAAALHAGTPQIIVPFILDQFYWAEKMFWLGVAPEPLKKTHLLPDEEDVVRIAQAADALSNALKVALSSKIKERASEVSKKISSEDGVAEALKVLKEEVFFSSKPATTFPVPERSYSSNADLTKQ